MAPRSSFWVSLSRFHRKHRTFTVRHNSRSLRAHRIGDRRLRLPVPILPYEGLHYVSEFGKACPQQLLKLPNGLNSDVVLAINQVVARFYDAATPTDEDCKEHVVLLSHRELKILEV